MDVGARLLAARRRARMSREQLAVKAGLSWSAITQIESGRRPNPGARTIAALVGALGVTADLLVGNGDVATALLVHHAIVYAGMDDFVGTAGPFVAEGVAAGETVLVVTTARNADALRERLGDDANAVQFGASDSWYRSPRDALAAYREFTDRTLANGAEWIRVLGEPVWADRSPEGIARWIRYEALATLAFAPYPLTLACAYDEDALPPEIVRHARSAHSHRLTRGAVTSNEEFADPAELCLGD